MCFIISLFHFIDFMQSKGLGCVLTLLLSADFFYFFFANSLHPDQVQQNIEPDLDPNFLTL